jgi:hypothetical protein
MYMARFLARFDSGSGGWDVGFAAGLINETFSGSFDRMRIGVDSASGALLRNGLIASRSAVSSDIYAELDFANQNGAQGTYFPPDLFTITAGALTGSVYTSSVDGIRTPISNDYGVVASTNINYSRRPTASITSSQTTLVGPTNPLDSASVNYNVYLSASQAVQTVLNRVQNGAGTSYSPYTRQGNRPSRTFNTIWHDPDLQYFAWDDLTPGTPTNVSLFRSSSTDFYWTNDFKYRLDWGPGYEFLNDKQATPRIALWFYSSSLDSGSANQALVKTGLSVGATSYVWNINVGTANITTDGQYQVLYELNFRDSRVIAEGGTNIGDGPIATAVAGQMTLYRLYGPFTVKQYNGSGDVGLCSSYTGADTTAYSNKSWSTVTVAVSDNVYTNTNVENPTELGISPSSRYRITTAGSSQNYTFDMATAGLVDSVSTCT